MPPMVLSLHILSTNERKLSMSKLYRVYFKSRYYPLEGTRSKLVSANSKKDIRNNWHDIINTDEYKITKIEEA